MLRLYDKLRRTPQHHSSAIATRRTGFNMKAILDILPVQGLTVGSLLNAKTLLIIFALLNIKALHLVWFIRFLRAFIRRLTDPAPSKHLSPRCLFLPAISKTRSPALECDYNLHKSNSTYFTDLDMSRGNFALVLFSKPFHPFPGPKHLSLVLGGATCTWRKEIKPYEAYELWTRIVSWDEKWMYVVTHFVKKGAFVPEEYVMQPWRKGKKTKGANVAKDDDAVLKTVYASSVSRYVFKNNRRTVPPEQVMKMAGLLPSDEEGLAKVEQQRLQGLPVGKLEAGWDAVHAAFQPGPAALGFYASAC